MAHIHFPPCGSTTRSRWANPLGWPSPPGPPPATPSLSCCCCDRLSIWDIEEVAKKWRHGGRRLFGLAAAAWPTETLILGFGSAAPPAGKAIVLGCLVVVVVLVVGHPGRAPCACGGCWPAIKGIWRLLDSTNCRMAAWVRVFIIISSAAAASSQVEEEARFTGIEMVGQTAAIQMAHLRFWDKVELA